MHCLFPLVGKFLESRIIVYIKVSHLLDCWHRQLIKCSNEEVILKICLFVASRSWCWVTYLSGAGDQTESTNLKWVKTARDSWRQTNFIAFADAFRHQNCNVATPSWGNCQHQPIPTLLCSSISSSLRALSDTPEVTKASCYNRRFTKLETQTKNHAHTFMK